MVNRYKKRCSTNVVIRKMSIKSTMLYHHKHDRITIIKEMNDNKCW
jgi:hypothetical protein